MRAIWCSSGGNWRGPAPSRHLCAASVWCSWRTPPSALGYAPGVDVDEAEDGTGALELLTSIGDFDVAIVDVCLGTNGHGAGDLSGTEAIRALRKAQPDLGIVAHGPQAEHHAATEAIRAGAPRYGVTTEQRVEPIRAW